MTVNEGALAVDRVRVETLRRDLGAHLATYRRAAGVSQPELGQVIGRTRSTVSKIEHGTRAMPGTLWKVADEVCRADGALVAEHSALADAERDYRGRWRAHQHQARQAAARADVDALRASSTSPHAARAGTMGVDGEVAEELIREVVTILARSVGRREASRGVAVGQLGTVRPRSCWSGH